MKISPAKYQPFRWRFNCFVAGRMTLLQNNHDWSSLFFWGFFFLALYLSSFSHSCNPISWNELQQYIIFTPNLKLSSALNNEISLRPSMWFNLCISGKPHPIIESNGKLRGKPSSLTLKAEGIVFIPPPNEVGGGVYWIHLVRLSVRPSVRPSVCRRHGFRSISQVCFGISISNFICMLMVAIGRSLLIFSDVTFKMAAWRPYWIFWFPDSNFTSALNINFKLQRHNTYVYG